jgi:hypothetical protein
MDAPKAKEGVRITVRTFHGDTDSYDQWRERFNGYLFTENGDGSVELQEILRVNLSQQIMLKLLKQKLKLTIRYLLQ